MIIIKLQLLLSSSLLLYIIIIIIIFYVIIVIIFYCNFRIITINFSIRYIITIFAFIPSFMPF